MVCVLLAPASIVALVELLGLTPTFPSAPPKGPSEASGTGQLAGRSVVSKLPALNEKLPGPA